MTHNFFEKDLEKCFKEPKVKTSEPSLEPIGLHQHKASRQKWECQRCLFPNMAGRPGFDFAPLSPRDTR